jgi:nucleoid DNA-binding protein
MALTKAQIVAMLAEQNGFAKNKNIEIVENLISIIKQTLKAAKMCWSAASANSV